MSETTHPTDDLTHQNQQEASSVDAGITAQQGPAETVSTADLPVQTEDALQAPCSYENLQVAADVLLDAKELENFKTLAAELKLSPQQAQKLVDFESACVQRKTEQNLAQKRRQTAQWANETKALYGAGLEQEITFALRAANAFGGPELRELLEETGLGNHPVVIRTLSGIGRTISEDTCPGGTPAASQDKTFAEALYGKQN